jgi:predicted nucleic acid-binding protein
LVGDPDAARQRLEIVRPLPRLETNPRVVEISRVLVDEHAVPDAAVDDALHIALAAVHGMEFLLTWNCTHIANAERLELIRWTIEAQGFAGPVICTPEELLGDSP